MTSWLLLCAISEFHFISEHILYIFLCIWNLRSSWIFLTLDVLQNNSKDEDEPGWAPLRETYMLGLKLKDWDKMQVKPPDLALFALGDTGNSFA